MWAGGPVPWPARWSTLRGPLVRRLLGLMSIRPSYKICPGDRLEVEVVQPDGTRALVVGELDKVPSAAGGCALRIVVTEAQVKAPTARGVAPVGRGHQDRFRRRAAVRTAAASTNNAKPRTATSRGHGVMGLIMMELGPSTPAAKAAAVPLGRLLTPWGSHHGAYDVNRLVTCPKEWPSSELATAAGGGH
jgi:hypothetical protein